MPGVGATMQLLGRNLGEQSDWRSVHDADKVGYGYGERWRSGAVAKLLSYSGVSGQGQIVFMQHGGSAGGSEASLSEAVVRRDNEPPPPSYNGALETCI
eukprot:3680272-Amphidinium_carterae.1